MSRKIRVAAHSASVFGESVAYFRVKSFLLEKSVSVGMTDCQAVHGAAACRLSAEQDVKQWGCTSPSDELRPEGHDLGVETLGLRLPDEGT